MELFPGSEVFVEVSGPPKVGFFRRVLVCSARCHIDDFQFPTKCGYRVVFMSNLKTWIFRCCLVCRMFINELELELEKEICLEFESNSIPYLIDRKYIRFNSRFSFVHRKWNWNPCKMINNPFCLFFLNLLYFLNHM